MYLFALRFTDMVYQISFVKHILYNRKKTYITCLGFAISLFLLVFLSFLYIATTLIHTSTP